MSEQLTAPQPAPGPAPPPPVTGPGTARSRWTVPIRVLAALVTGAVVLATAAIVVATFLTRTVTERSTITEPVKRIRITNDTGDVVVRAGSGRAGAVVQSRAVNTFQKAEHHEILAGDVLQITGSCRGTAMIAGFCALDLTVSVAPGTVVDIHAGTGDVSVTGISGPVTVNTGTGDVRVRDVGAALRINSGIGDVTGARLAGGIVDAHSDTGDVQLGFATRPDQVQARTGIGDVRVTVPDDGTTYRVQAETGIGDRQVDVPTSPDSERVLYLTSDTGDLHLTTTP